MLLLKSLSARHCCIFACMILLPALPVWADTPAAPAIHAEGTPHAIILQNTVPSDILKFMHWDQTANLPVGVTQILPLTASNALSVTGSPSGLAKVEEIVEILDIAPLHVQVEFALAHATDTDLKASHLDFVQYAAGLPAAKFLKTLTSQRAVTREPILTTSDNVLATFKIAPALPTPGVESVTFDVTPHINPGNSVTLALHSIIVEGQSTNEISTLRTVKNGETLVIIMSHLPAQADGLNRVLFVTPSVLPIEAPHS